MQEKGQAAEIIRLRQTGLELLRGETGKRAAGLAGWFCLGFAGASARIMEDWAPFGVAMTAQAGVGPGGAVCLLGTVLGYLLTGGFAWGLRYVAAVTLVFTAAYVLRDSPVLRSGWLMPGLAFAVLLLTSLLGGQEVMGTPTAVIPLLTEAVLAGAGTMLFRLALREQSCTTEAAELQHTVSVTVLLGALLLAAAQIRLAGVLALGRSLAVLAVLCAAWTGGPASGCCMGTALGAFMDLGRMGVPVFAMAYGLTGLAAGIFARRNRLLFVLCGVGVNAAAAAWGWSSGQGPALLFEMLAASVGFTVLPAGLLARAGAWLHQPSPGRGESGLRRYAADRVRRMGEAFQALFSTVQQGLGGRENDGDAASVFDRAADQVCAGCAQRSRCWEREYVSTSGAMNDASGAMLARGRLNRADLPEWFRDRCTLLEPLIAAVNGQMHDLMFRRQLKARLAENRLAAFGQYADMARIMSGVSRELGSAQGTDRLAERRLLRYLTGRELEAEVSVFRAGGRLRVVLESRQLARLTERPDYLEQLSGVLGLRLCRPAGQEERDGTLTLVEAEPLAATVGIAAVKKTGEPVSGDRGTYFKTDGGVLCVILSDGMGSGEEAARESIGVVQILEQFLRAGMEPEMAMKFLNAGMLLKNGENWGYATVDLMCVDLFTGETCFYKYGAAPSYVRTGRGVHRVRGESMAVGLCAGEGDRPDILRMKLTPGSVAIIASDGLYGGADDRWLRKLLLRYDGGGTRELAREALRTAMAEYGCSDDMTVLAVQVDTRA